MAPIIAQNARQWWARACWRWPWRAAATPRCRTSRRPIRSCPIPPSFAYLPKPGLLFDRAPPGVTVVRDGPNGELLNGPAPPLVPDSAVDAAVAEPLRSLLSPLERRRLAEASQRAAAEYTLQPVAWEATDDSGDKTAVGNRGRRRQRLSRRAQRAPLPQSAPGRDQGREAVSGAGDPLPPGLRQRPLCLDHRPRRRVLLSGAKIMFPERCRNGTRDQTKNPAGNDRRGQMK